MEITGKIIAILPIKSGVSQRTGTEWNSQDYVIETHDNYPKKCCFNIYGKEKIEAIAIKMGEELKVSFDIDAHEYQGRYFNSVMAWKVDRVSQDAQQPANTTAQSAPASAAPQPAPEVTNAPASEDDLPF